MSYVKFYLDVPFDISIPKEKLKAIIDNCDSNNKGYPKNIFNSTPTTVYLFFTYASRQRIKVKTNIKAKAELWNFKNGCFKTQASGSLELNNELNELTTHIMKNFARLQDNKTIICKEDVMSLAKALINGDQIVSTNTLKNAMEQFFLKKENILTEGTLKEYRTVFKSIKEYEILNKLVLKFGDLNQGFFNEYEQFLVNKKNPYDETRGLLNDTIAKYIATLKTFMFWAFESGFISNIDHLLKIKTKIKKRVKNEIVVLSEPELFQLYNYDFSGIPRLERARDLFCFACFTGQRFSDIMRFSKDDFDNNIWEFTSFKTKKRVIVPFEGFIGNALNILKKYDYLLPSISNQKLNDYLKELGEIAGLDKSEKITRFSGVKEIIIKNPKYQFMSSHMGRRTFVTLLLEKGIPITIVQKLTQHSDLRTLLKYESHSQNTLINTLKTSN